MKINNSLRFFIFVHWLRKSSICHFEKNLMEIGEPPLSTHTLTIREMRTLPLKWKKYDIINYLVDSRLQRSSHSGALSKSETSRHTMLFVSVTNQLSVLQTAVKPTAKISTRDNLSNTINVNGFYCQYTWNVASHAILIRSSTSTAEAERHPIIFAKWKSFSFKLKLSINFRFHSDKFHRWQCARCSIVKGEICRKRALH